MSHQSTISGLSKAMQFLTEKPGLPPANVEVTPVGASVAVGFHIHIYSVEALRATHEALRPVVWETNATNTSAWAMVDGCGVTIYFNPILHMDEAQAYLREIGLVKGLVAL